jgi:hypothetical protein
MSRCTRKTLLVMPGTRVRLRRPEHKPSVPGIHVFAEMKIVEGRDKPCHDESR